MKKIYSSKVLLSVLFIIIVIVFSVYYSNFNNRAIGDALPESKLSFTFSMKDLEVFNSFDSEITNKNKRMKVELTIGNEDYEVELSNASDYISESISRDLKGFTLRTDKKSRINNRQDYDVHSIDSIDYRRMEEIHELAERLELYFPYISFTEIDINGTYYGDFVMREAYNEDFLEKRSLDEGAIFKVDWEKDGELQVDCIANSIAEAAVVENIRSLVAEGKNDPTLFEKYFDYDYIAKLETLASDLKIKSHLLISDYNTYIFNGKNGKIYPIVDAGVYLNSNLRLHKNDFNDLYSSIKDNSEIAVKKEYYIEQLAIGSENSVIPAFGQQDRDKNHDNNILEKLFIGNRDAKIDHDNKVVFINLEEGSVPVQKISYKFSNSHDGLYIQSLQYNEAARKIEKSQWTKVEDNESYNFGGFIYRGRISYFEGIDRVTYELYVTTGDVPIVEISTADNNGDIQEINKSDKISCTIRILSVKNEEYINKIIPSGIEFSGEVPTKKKNYSIKMDKGYKLEGMTKSKDWILDGGGMDASLIRKKLTFDSLNQIYEAREIDSKVPRSSFVELILDGEYQGVYTLGNKVDAKLLDLEDYDKNEEYNALLYRAENPNANFSKENVLQDAYKNEYKDFPKGLQPKEKDNDPILGWHSGYEQKWPKVDEYGEYWRRLEEFIKFVATSPDEEFNQEIFNLVDIDKFMSMWILLQLENNLYGSVDNQFIIKNKGQNEKWYFIPWRTNSTFGRDKENNKVEYSVWTTNSLFTRCMEIETFRTTYKTVWKDLVEKGVLTAQNYYSMIDSYKGVIADSQKRDRNKWLISDDINFSDEIEYMKEWTANRINWLNTYVDGL